MPAKILASYAVPRSSGRTDFEPPLRLAYDIASKTKLKYSKVIYYFMSDGIAFFP